MAHRLFSSQIHVDFDNSFTHQYAVPANPCAHDDSLSFLGTGFQQAWTSHFHSLGDAPVEAAVGRLVVVTEQSGQGAVRATGCGVFRHAIQGSKHTRADVKLVGAMGIEVDVRRYAFGD